LNSRFNGRLYPVWQATFYVKIKYSIFNVFTQYSLLIVTGFAGYMLNLLPCFRK